MMTAKGLTPSPNSAAATGARGRSTGFFPMSRPKWNVAFATMATTITWRPWNRETTSGISLEPE